MIEDKIYSVGEITREIKRVIQDGFGALWVEGEISGYKRHSSGHRYFTLKDGTAQLSCAMWKTSAGRLAFEPADGMKVRAWGNLEVYEPAGRYQLIVALMRADGIGDLARLFQAMVEKLKAEGLFARERKRPLPLYPEIIGLVTSGDGAALHDMLTVAGRRWPLAQLVLCPVKVQGVGAPEEITAAIAAFNREGEADVIVVGRGGGSLEDLWAFNDEQVARAIYASRIPVVSAVGHEVDVTIADFVADERAPTPSAAMEILLPDRSEVADYVAELARRLATRRTELIRHSRQRLTTLAQHWALKHPANVVHLTAQRLDDLETRLDSAFNHSVRNKQTALVRVKELLAAYHPLATLERGYAVVQDPSGRIVRDAGELSPGSSVSISFARGGAEAEIRKLTGSGIIHESH